MVASGRRRILLVEDDEDLVATLREVLEQDGFDVVSAATGEGAIELCGEHPIVALVDLHIEGQVTGAELISALRQRLPLGAKLFLLSAERDLEVHAARLGADGWLEKPFDIEELLRLVENATQEPAPLHP